MSFVLFLLFGFFHPHINASTRHHINITSAHIIALSPPTAARLGAEARTWLSAVNDNSPYVVIHEANTGFSSKKVPVATRIAILQGRHNHAAIGSDAALGCLLSHTAIWRSMREGDTFAVFEEVSTFSQPSLRASLR